MNGNLRRYYAEDQNGVSPLRLFVHWLGHAPGFARPAPPRPRMPLRFTCERCHTEVPSTASHCRCGAFFYAPVSTKAKSGGRRSSPGPPCSRTLPPRWRRPEHPRTTHKEGKTMPHEASEDDAEPYFGNYEVEVGDGTLDDEPICGGDE